MRMRQTALRRFSISSNCQLGYSNRQPKVVLVGHCRLIDKLAPSKYDRLQLLIISTRFIWRLICLLGRLFNGRIITAHISSSLPLHACTASPASLAPPHHYLVFKAAADRLLHCLSREGKEYEEEPAVDERLCMCALAASQYFQYCKTTHPSNQ